MPKNVLRTILCSEWNLNKFAGFHHICLKVHILYSKHFNTTFDPNQKLCCMIFKWCCQRSNLQRSCKIVNYIIISWILTFSVHQLFYNTSSIYFDILKCEWTGRLSPTLYFCYLVWIKSICITISIVSTLGNFATPQRRNWSANERLWDVFCSSPTDDETEQEGLCLWQNGQFGKIRFDPCPAL